MSARPCGAVLKLIFDCRGEAVQVDPIKPTLKAPGMDRLKLNYDKLLLKNCFQVQLAPLHRGDSDALYHQYGVKLRNMYDVQVVFCLKRDEEAGGGACGPARYFVPHQSMAFDAINALDLCEG
jgi:hypothetical protein